MKKREFLLKIGQAALAAPLVSFNSQAGDPINLCGYDFVDEAEFWERIRKDYALKPAYINLENGYYNIIPKPTLQKFMAHVNRVNYEGAYYMRTEQWDNKKRVGARLAKMVGCSNEELILTRNATESLDMIITGYPWQKGDEAIMAEQDYGSMLDQFDLAARRFGIVNRKISVPNHPTSDEEIVALYEGMITPKTKLIMVCHMINITGQILPIRKICDMAHAHGVDVMVDGAHCIGHFNVNIEDLQCDYYASSLHKWLSTPLGVGLLYVRKEKISNIWPLLADSIKEPENIFRLNHTGTHPVHTDLTIHDAIDYLEMIGIERKENRMRFLQRYWSGQLRGVKNIVVNTPKEEHRSCGIANVGIAHMKPADLANTLLEEFQVFTVAIDSANVQGCRITPNVYTTTKELDHFVNAMKVMAGRV